MRVFLDPLPVLPPNQSSDLGEGEWKLFMNAQITNQVLMTPPPFSVFENGGGRRGSGVVARVESLRGRMSEGERQALP